jgi:hypothetical protein
MATTSFKDFYEAYFENEDQDEKFKTAFFMTYSLM